MKFLIAGIIAALFATSTEATSLGNIRNLAVENCKTHNAAGACTECIFRYVLDNGACKKVSDQCKTWNATSGACTSCYDGWNLSNGACVLPGGPSQPNPVEGCNTYAADGSCSVCEYRRVRISGSECRRVSDQCNTWNATTGACTSCYGGYTLTNGQCLA